MSNSTAASSIVASDVQQQLLTEGVLKSFKIGKIFTQNTKQINGLDFDHSGEFLVTSSEDESINVYDVINGKHKKILYSKKYGVNLIKFAHRENNVLHASTKCDDTIRYLSLHDNQYIRYFKGHKGKVSSLEISNITDSFVTGSNDSVRMWDLRSPNCQGLLTVQSSPLIAIDPQSLVFAIGLESKCIRLYDIRNYQEGPFSTFNIPLKTTWQSIQFSPEGKDILVSTKDNFLILLDSFEGSTKERFEGNINDDSLGLQGTFSPDGRFILCGSQDGTVAIWNRHKGRFPLGYLEGQPDAIENVKFNSKYMTFATASYSKLALWIPEY